MSSAEVDAWFEAYDNPQNAAVQRVREMILAADPRITECIKWKAPTFVYIGNMASFYPKAKKHVSLMFHRGALIPGDHPLLEGTGDTSRKLGEFTALLRRSHACQAPPAKRRTKRSPSRAATSESPATCAV